MHWDKAAKALDTYTADLRQAAWGDVKHVCHRTNMTIAMHKSKLPHNGIGFIKTVLSSGEAIPEGVPTTPFGMVKEIMGILQQHFEVEEALAPSSFGDTVDVAWALTETGFHAAELADILSGAPDWRIVQTAQWKCAEILEHFTSFMRWQSEVVREVTRGISQHGAPERGAIASHANFVVKLARLVARYCRFFEAHYSDPETELLRAVATRSIVSAGDLEQAAKGLVSSVESIAQPGDRDAEFAGVAAGMGSPFGHKTNRTAEVKCESLISTFLEGRHSGKETARRQRVAEKVSRHSTQ